MFSSLFSKYLSTQFQLATQLPKKVCFSLVSSADGEASNGGLKALAGPHNKASINTSSAELGDALPSPGVRKDLGDGILVGAVKSCVRSTGLGTLVETFELVHGAVYVCMSRGRERVCS